MDSLELTTVEDLVRHHTPELMPYTDVGTRILIHFAAFFFAATVGLTTLAVFGVHAPGTNLILVGLTGIPGPLFSWWMMREQRRRYSNELRESPWKFYEAVASNFADEVRRQRARTIGPHSEWGRARLGLEGAAHDADRSVAYWTQRLSTEPNSEIAQTQLSAATRLAEKFHTALSGLDERARLLVTFFNDCEARVAVLQSTKRDYEEIRKLEALADRSDEVVVRAEETLASIGASFVSEALRVGNALGGLERIGLANLAGEVSVDHIEALADRILESDERDRNALERMAGSI